MKIVNEINKLINYFIWRYHLWEEIKFDKKFGIDTSELISNEFSGDYLQSEKYAVKYEPIHLHIIKDMLKCLSSDLSHTIFVDLGSGKGRALFVAAAYPFRQIIGVEFSKELHDIACKNTQCYKSSSKSEADFLLYDMDVMQFEFPKSNLVIFLYNPFFGVVMQAIIKKLEQFIQSGNYTIQVLYRNPQCANMFMDSGLFDLAVSTTSYHIYNSKLKI